MTRVFYSCDTCEEQAIPSCSECGSTHFTITKKAPAKIICGNCGKSQVGTFTFDCENGHTNTISDINKVIELIATDTFVKQIISTINIYYPDIAFEKFEYFSLCNGSLNLHKSPNYEKLNPTDR